MGRGDEGTGMSVVIPVPGQEVKTGFLPSLSGQEFLARGKWRTGGIAFSPFFFLHLVEELPIGEMDLVLHY